MRMISPPTMTIIQKTAQKAATGQAKGLVQWEVGTCSNDGSLRYYGGILSQNDKGWLVNIELVMWDEAVQTLGDVEAENQLDVVVESWVAA